ncbi:MAG: hypothetical protein MJ252_12300, partial [archaeon]|nr:hypothetical protein [archaeon]
MPNKESLSSSNHNNVNLKENVNKNGNIISTNNIDSSKASSKNISKNMPIKITVNQKIDNESENKKEGEENDLKSENNLRNKEGHRESLKDGELFGNSRHSSKKLDGNKLLVPGSTSQVKRKFSGESNGSKTNRSRLSLFIENSFIVNEVPAINDYDILLGPKFVIKEIEGMQLPNRELEI